MHAVAHGGFTKTFGQLALPAATQRDELSRLEHPFEKKAVGELVSDEAKPAYEQAQRAISTYELSKK